jgi:hypothetical protein
MFFPGVEKWFFQGVEKKSEILVRKDLVLIL